MNDYSVLNIETVEVENKIPDNSKYITPQEFNKFTTGSLAARLKQANLVRKTYFDNKLVSCNRNVSSNKTKYLKVQK